MLKKNGIAETRDNASKLQFRFKLLAGIQSHCFAPGLYGKNRRLIKLSCHPVSEIIYFLLLGVSKQQERLSALCRALFVDVYLAYLRSYGHLKIVKCIGMY